MLDCIIVGAGPVGCRLASKLAGSGLDVLVLEEHDEIGLPVHCTGIVGKEAVEAFNIEEDCILNEIESVRVRFPDGNMEPLPTSIRPLIIDREKLDKRMASRARKAGAEILPGFRAVRLEQDGHGVRVVYTRNHREFSKDARLCVFAAGALSPLPYKHGISRPPYLYHSAQMDVLMQDLEGIELYLGKSLAPGSFAYAVDVGDNVAKVGLITGSDTKEYMKRLLDLPGFKNRLTKVISKPRYRPMPFGISEKTASGRVFAVGDCAGQLKSTTGGGIYLGLRCADILAGVILNYRYGDDFNCLKMGAAYESGWIGELQDEIRAGIKLRKILEKVDDAWWIELGKILGEAEIEELIRSYDDFDHHYRFIYEFFRLPAARRFLFEIVKQKISKSFDFLGISGSEGV